MMLPALYISTPLPEKTTNTSSLKKSPGHSWTSRHNTPLEINIISVGIMCQVQVHFRTGRSYGGGSRKARRRKKTPLEKSLPRYMVKVGDQ
jgi:hypothetical protein